MTGRVLCLVVFLLTLPSLPSTLSASPLQSEREEQENKEEKKQEEEKKVRVLGGWLNKRDPLEGMRYSAHQVAAPAALSAGTGARSPGLRRGGNHPCQCRDDSDSDPNLSRRRVRLTETPHGHGGNPDSEGKRHEDAVRTISSPDANGRLQVQVEETQQVVSTGDDEFAVQTVVSQLGPRRRLEPVRQLVQTERRRPDGTLELDRISYVLDGNRRWEAVERRTAVTRSGGEESRTEEEVYRSDFHRRLSLSERITSREWEDEDGTIRRTIETRSLNPQGRLQLAERVNTVRSTTPDGLVETVQDLEVRNQGTGQDATVPENRLFLFTGRRGRGKHRDSCRNHRR